MNNYIVVVMYSSIKLKPFEFYRRPVDISCDVNKMCTNKQQLYVCGTMHKLFFIKSNFCIVGIRFIGVHLKLAININGSGILWPMTM